MLNALMLVVHEPGYFFAPGMMAGWVPFPQGMESDWGQLYLVVAILLNIFIYSWAVFGIWLLIERVRRRETTTRR